MNTHRNHGIMFALMTTITLSKNEKIWKMFCKLSIRKVNWFPASAYVCYVDYILFDLVLNSIKLVLLLYDGIDIKRSPFILLFYSFFYGNKKHVNWDCIYRFLKLNEILILFWLWQTTVNEIENVLCLYQILN